MVMGEGLGWGRGENGEGERWVAAGQRVRVRGAPAMGQRGTTAAACLCAWAAPPCTSLGCWLPGSAWDGQGAGLSPHPGQDSSGAGLRGPGQARLRCLLGSRRQGPAPHSRAY